MNMYQIVKFIGITPAALARLHEVLRSDNIKTTKEIGFVTNSGFGKNRETCVKLLSSRFDEAKGGYCVEISVAMSIDGLDPNGISNIYSGHHKSAVLFPSIDIMKALYAAIGVYPDKESLGIFEENEQQPTMTLRR